MQNRSPNTAATLRHRLAIHTHGFSAILSGCSNGCLVRKGRLRPCQPLEVCELTWRIHDITEFACCNLGAVTLGEWYRGRRAGFGAASRSSGQSALLHRRLGPGHFVDRLAHLEQSGRHGPHGSAGPFRLRRVSRLAERTITTTSSGFGPGSCSPGTRAGTAKRSRWCISSAPHPWSRTGPGKALDGKPKFDLRQFNDDYFTRLRERVKAAGDRGIYVAVMLFEGWGIQFSPDAWRHHPFHPEQQRQRHRRRPGRRRAGPGNPQLAAARRSPSCSKPTSARSSTRSTISTTCSTRSPTRTTRARPSGSTA